MKSPILFSTILTALSFAGGAIADQVKMEVNLANPQLEAGVKNTTYLKVGLTGFELDAKAERAPVNVTLVIDKSGSMSGGKIRQAREAAKMAISRLNEDDIVSLVAYDSTVHVLIPATKLTDKDEVLRRIDELGSGGSTALFAGVSKGAAELRKFHDRERVNRVILLSDGKANVGPSSPGELGELGASLVKEGISVSTIGLGTGYHEDLMAQLAMKSDGNHIFIEHAEQLAQVYDEEFGDILSVVAQEISIEIDVAEGIRPVRVLGRDADISGQNVVAQMNQLYSEQEKYVLLELEVPQSQPELSRQVATVKVSYANMETNTLDELTSTVGVKFVADANRAASAINQTVMVDCVTQIANDNNITAMKLRDQGKVEAAQDLLHQNYYFCRTNADWLKSEKLSTMATNNRVDWVNVQKDDSAWREARKGQVYRQIGNASQQRGYTRGGKNSESQIVEQLNTGYATQNDDIEIQSPPPVLNIPNNPRNGTISTQQLLLPNQTIPAPVIPQQQQPEQPPSQQAAPQPQQQQQKPITKKAQAK
ncbi:MAG: VWA domain-containing protein [Verrucomicrobiota bacterium]